jgi:hypothetical protein
VNLLYKYRAYILKTRLTNIVLTVVPLNMLLILYNILYNTVHKKTYILFTNYSNVAFFNVQNRCLLKFYENGHFMSRCEFRLLFG